MCSADQALMKGDNDGAAASGRGGRADRPSALEVPAPVRLLTFARIGITGHRSDVGQGINLAPVGAAGHGRTGNLGVPALGSHTPGRLPLRIDLPEPRSCVGFHPGIDAIEPYRDGPDARAGSPLRVNGARRPP